jgi:hypothetical protein
MKAAVAIAVALAGSACDMRPLTSADLYGAAHGGNAGSAHGGNAGAANGGNAGGGNGGGAAGASGWDAAGGGEGGLDGGPDDAADAGPGDAPDAGCPQTCAADQFCDELTGRCAPRAGSGMLSGVVTDACSGAALSALLGIAGQHSCSYFGKGSYFFSGLPVGMLKLAAAKEGYELYGVTVEIRAGGVIRDVAMTRIGGCAAPAPPDNPCTCTTSSCTAP